MAVEDHEPTQNEGIYKTFVTMMIIFSSGFAAYTINGCVTDKMAKGMSALIMASWMVFMVITVWFGGVYVYDDNGTDKFRVNGIPGLTKDRPHYLHRSSTDHTGVDTCLVPDVAGTDSEEKGYTEMERNFWHLLVCSLVGSVIGGGITALNKT